MTAMTAARPGSVRVINRVKVPLAANAKVFKNSLATALTSGSNRGYFKQSSSAEGGVVVGRFFEDVDNTGGANGDKSAEVVFFRERTCFLVSNDTGTAVVAADREQLAYMLDDQTVSGAANGPPVNVFEVTSEGVWIEPDQSAHGLRVQAGTSTLVAGTKTITGVALTANSTIQLSMRDPGTGALTTFIALDAPVASRNSTTGQFVVNAIDNAKATLTTAICTFDWMIVG